MSSCVLAGAHRNIVGAQDPHVHLKNLKPSPVASPLVDACIECGFCESNCPSRDVTLTPRQRITSFREMSRLEGLHSRNGAEDERCAGGIESSDATPRLFAGCIHARDNHGIVHWDSRQPAIQRPIQRLPISSASLCISVQVQSRTGLPGLYFIPSCLTVASSCNVQLRSCCHTVQYPTGAGRCGRFRR